MTYTDIAGWAGMITVLVAYALLSSKMLGSQSRMYHWMNLVGVSCIGVNVFVQKAWPVLVLECVWGLIAIATLIRIQLEKGERNDRKDKVSCKS